MNDTARALLILLIAVVTLYTAGMAFIVYGSKPAQLYTDRVFYTHFGGVYCGSMEIQRCGVKLWNCTDERVYECLHDIAWKDVK